MDAGRFTTTDSDDESKPNSSLVKVFGFKKWVQSPDFRRLAHAWKQSSRGNENRLTVPIFSFQVVKKSAKPLGASMRRGRPDGC